MGEALNLGVAIRPRSAGDLGLPERLLGDAATTQHLGGPATPGTVEAWARSADNPVEGWYGLKKGLRGRFGMYIPPLLEALGLAELEHGPRNNRMRAL